MRTSRRTFLKTLAAAAPAAVLAGCGRPDLDPALIPPSVLPAGPAPAAAVLVSGGTLTKDGHFVDAARAAHRAHYRAGQHILLVLYATLPADRDRVEKRLQAMLAEDGFTAESSHHHTGRAARRMIAGAEAFFVGGGETFLLLRTLIDTAQLDVLRERVLAGAPYHGTSAGANIAGPLIGCTNDFPVVDIPTRASLGIFPAVINPHHPPEGDPNYAGRAGKIKNYLRLYPRDIVLGLASGGSIARRRDDRVSLLSGPAYLYTAGTARSLAAGPVDELSARAAGGA